MRKTKAEIRDEEAKAIAGNMKRLMTGYRTLLEVELEKENITLAQLRMLHALDAAPDLSAAGLARTCFITPQSMQAIVTRGEKDGLIRRQPSETNRRVLTTHLTDEGRRVLERGMELWTVISRDMWSEAKLSDMELLNKVLISVVDRMQPQLEALHTARRKTA
jgi:DNA-binding MarR family transcriptional regulator